MEHDGSSVTLIFYRVGERWWKEPLLNIVAAAAQFSSLTHVEIAIGEDAGSNGTMANVCRVFNDNVGVVRPSQPLRYPICTKKKRVLPRRSSSSAPVETLSTPTCSWVVPSRP